MKRDDPLYNKYVSCTHSHRQRANDSLLKPGVDSLYNAIRVRRLASY